MNPAMTGLFYTPGLPYMSVFLRDNIFFRDDGVIQVPTSVAFADEVVLIYHRHIIKVQSSLSGTESITFSHSTARHSTRNCSVRYQILRGVVPDNRSLGSVDVLIDDCSRNAKRLLRA
jgi:hypothetical protein